MLLEDLMSEDLDRVRPDMSLAAASLLMREHDVTCLPVNKGERLVGLVTDHDIDILGRGMDSDIATVEDVMSKGAFCFYFQEAEEAAETMEHWHVCRLPIIDCENRMVGVVTVEDV